MRPLAIAQLVESLAARRLDGEHATGLEPTEAGREVRVLVHARHLVIVESRPPDAGIVEREPERPDEVQRRSVLAQSRMTLPAFGGISGSNRMIWNM